MPTNPEALGAVIAAELTAAENLLPTPLPDDATIRTEMMTGLARALAELVIERITLNELLNVSELGVQHGMTLIYDAGTHSWRPGWPVIPEGAIDDFGTIAKPLGSDRDFGTITAPTGPDIDYGVFPEGPPAEVHYAGLTNGDQLVDTAGDNIVLTGS